MFGYDSLVPFVTFQGLFRVSFRGSILRFPAGHPTAFPLDIPHSFLPWKIVGKDNKKRHVLEDFQVSPQHFVDLTLMVQKSGEHQLRLVVWPIIYDGFCTSQVVGVSEPSTVSRDVLCTWPMCQEVLRNLDGPTTR